MIHKNKREKCKICDCPVKKFGLNFCSTECLWINNNFNKRSKNLRTLKKYIKEKIISIKIETKTKKYCINYNEKETNKKRERKK